MCITYTYRCNISFEYRPRKTRYIYIFSKSFQIMLILSKKHSKEASRQTCFVFLDKQSKYVVNINIIIRYWAFSRFYIGRFQIKKYQTGRFFFSIRLNFTFSS